MRLIKQCRCAVKKPIFERRDVPAVTRISPKSYTAISPNNSSGGDELGDESRAETDYLPS